MVDFCATVQKSYSLFYVESLDWRVDFKIRINSMASQEKENKKFYVQLMKKWELLHLTLNNSKSEGDNQDQIKNVQDKESSSY